MPLDDAETTVTVYRDLAYRDLPDGDLSLDLYRPEGAQRRPAVVAIHGGAWRMGRKGELSRFALDLAQRAGVVVADVDYRLSGRATFPAQIDDVTAAISRLSERADEYGVDPDRIATLGHSAGAHLAALAAVTDGDAVGGATSERDASVQSVVGISGVYDLLAGPSGEMEVYEQLFGGGPDELSERYRAASPLRRADADTPPTLLAHGSADAVVPFEQSASYRERLDAVGATAELLRLDGGDHMVPFRNEYYDELCERIGSFLADQLSA